MIRLENIKGLNIPQNLIGIMTQKGSRDFFYKKIPLLFPFLNFPITLFENLNEVKDISEDNYFLKEEFWAIKSSLLEGKQIDLPMLDYDKSIIIAINKYPGEDLAIALDYRLNEERPSVVASDFNGKSVCCEWVLIANDLDELLEKLGLSFTENFSITSPTITHAEWGEITVDGKDKFKDVKCYPNGKKEWNWNETGTKHIPGIQISDMEELLNNDSEIIILSKGYHEKLQIDPDTEAYLTHIAVTHS